MNLALNVTTPAPFTLIDAEQAFDDWGANCGPGAIAAVLGRTLESVRPALLAQGFGAKRYTNPSLMLAVLRTLAVAFRMTLRPPTTATDRWPQYGLVRIQWEGPWTKPGVPIAARYRQTHWVGARRGAAGVEIFDINCMSVGGWVTLDEWRDQVVPRLLRECVPRATGGWHQTHVLEVHRG